MSITKKNSKLDFADQVRVLAQTGLAFASNPYEKERYSKLVDLASKEYVALSKLSKKSILLRFQKELGYITPKVGVNGAVFRKDGSLLLEKRADDGTWGVPGGWVDLGESPGEAVTREFKEETGLAVDPVAIVDIFSRSPGEYNQPHFSCHVLYLCESDNAPIIKSHESQEIKYMKIGAVPTWHRDHEKMARAAYAFWKKNNA